MFRGRILKTVIFVGRECQMLKDKQINPQQWSLPEVQNVLELWILLSLCSLQKCYTHICISLWKWSKEAGELSVGKSGACPLIYVETSKTFHLLAFHTANGCTPAEPHNSSL